MTIIDCARGNSLRICSQAYGFLLKGNAIAPWPKNDQVAQDFNQLLPRIPCNPGKAGNDDFNETNGKY